jgi:hypothetical protein
VSRENWEQLWRTVKELSAEYPDTMAFIGGIAVYLHSSSVPTPAAFVEFSHDGDFYFPLHDFADLRDEYEVTSNRRLNKHQIIKNGFEFDIYVERQNDLAVSYGELIAHSVVIDGTRAASLEHLLILKTDAAIGRKGTAKGDKDQRDVVRVLWLLGNRKAPINVALCQPYLTPERIAGIKLAINGPARLALARGNNHLASKILDMAQKPLTTLGSMFRT